MRKMAKDYYSVLGIKRGATDKEIKQAYRRLARRHHPDVNPGDKAAEARFKEINEAHEVLSDPEKRQKYDQFGDNWKYAEQFAGQRQGGGGERFSGFGDSGEPPLDDIFEHFFGSGGELGRRPRRGRDIEHPLEISLEEAYSVATRLIQTPAGRVEVKVPAGVTEGSRVRIAGKGGTGISGGPQGDLYLVISIRPHPLFERRGDDLLTEVSIPLTMVILGGEVEVPTLNGKVVLKVPPETQNGQSFRLNGLGMPRLANKSRGDLIVKAQVVLPTRLTTREKELFQELQGLRK